MGTKIYLSDIDLGKNEIRKVNKVLEKKWLSQGEFTEKFEKNFSNYLNCKYSYAVSSGTAALHLSLRALNIKAGDEVIVPSLTFVATVNAVLYSNAKAVFCDATSLNNFNISPENISQKISANTKAIIVMHYGGYACDMHQIKKIAQKNKLYIIEDAAHSIGGEYKDKKLGTIGDIGCFSFFANKNLVTGEGGMVVTNNSKFAEKIKLLRSHGMTTSSWDRYKGHSFSYNILDLGYNYRFDKMRSAIGIEQLKKINKNNSRRKELVNYYQKKLKGVSGITIPFMDYPYKSSYHLFPILLDNNINRKKFMLKLKSAGIQTSIHYLPVHKFSYYKNLFGEEHLPITEEIGKKVVTLPLHPLLKKVM